MFCGRNSIARGVYSGKNQAILRFGRSICITAGVWLGLSTAQAQHRDTIDRPNVVFLLASDLGWGDLSYGGNQLVETPAIDGLMEEGTVLDRLFVSSESAPSRASILTGRHFLLTGVTSNLQGANLLHDAEITVAEMLQPLGYRTGYFGQWENGANVPHHPLGQGFDEFAGRCEMIWDRESTVLHVGSEERLLEEPAGEVIARSAIDFIDTFQREPFLAYVAFPPVDHVDDKTLEMLYREKGCSLELAQVYAGIERLDQNVGRILDRIEELGLEKNTIVVFQSDSAPEAVEERFNAFLYGTKGSLHEGGLRVPSAFRWLGVIEPGLVLDEVCQHTDLVPTLMELTGGQPPRDRWVDGMSVAPLLLYGHLKRWPNRNLNSAQVPGHDLTQARLSLRTSRWRAVKDPPWRRKEAGRDDEQWELYDLMADPRQSYNVAEDYPFVLAKLKSDCSHWYRQITTFGAEPIPIEVGRRDWPEVVLQAEGASFAQAQESPTPVLTDWTEQATWPVKVVADLTAKIELEYRSTRDVEIELRIGDETRGLSLPANSQWNRLRGGEMLLSEGEFLVEVKNREPIGDLEIRSIWLRR